ncbi:MAG: hypothetical protein EA395_08015 [Phormidium sp. GEM2.Bin31]|nr:MAG: hypothetical protein EA395_08015 [Phormidium sp. GEM2.Bin31]
MAVKANTNSPKNKTLPFVPLSPRYQDSAASEGLVRNFEAIATKKFSHVLPGGNRGVYALRRPFERGVLGAKFLFFFSIYPSIPAKVAPHCPIEQGFGTSVMVKSKDI